MPKMGWFRAVRVTLGHWKYYHFIHCIQFSISLLLVTKIKIKIRLVPTSSRFGRIPDL